MNPSFSTFKPIIQPIAIALLCGAIGACASNYKKGNPSIASALSDAPGVESLIIDEFAIPDGLDEEARLEFLRMEAVENYRSYVELLPDGQAKQEAKRRLADLLVAQGPLVDNEEEIALLQAQQRIDKGANDGRDGRSGPTDLYLGLLSDHPDDNDNDVVRYQLARAYVNDGKPQKAIEALSTLVASHPLSDLVGEANFRRGELHFIQREYEEAADSYARVLDDRNAEKFYDQARYKLGWALFKQERYLDSLDTFHPLLDKLIPKYEYNVAQTKLDINLDSLPRVKRSLAQDGLRVSAMALVYLEGEPSIGEYIESRKGRHYDVPLYKSLAELYSGKGFHAESGQVYSEFANRNKTHPLAPLLTQRTVEAYENAGLSIDTRQAKGYYASTFSPGKAYWVKHNIALANSVTQKAQNYNLDLAKYHHAQSQQAVDVSSKTASLNFAVEWYEHYLNHFGNTQSAPDVNYLYADLLFENRRYKDAATQYEHTAYKYPLNKSSADAGYAAVLALFKHAEGVAAGNGGKYDAELIVAKEAATASAMQFTDVFVDHPYVPKVLVSAAEELYKLGDLRSSAVLSAKAVKHQPTPPAELRYAGWLVNAKAEFDQDKYSSAENAYRQLLSLVETVKPGDAQTRYQLTESLATSIFRQAEDQRKAGDLATAAQTFMRVVNDTPTASIVANAHYDASAAYIELEQWPTAIATLLSFRDNYRGHELQNDVTRKLAGVYLNNSQPVKAADEFTRIGLDATQAPDDRREALWRAAQLYDNNLGKGATTQRTAKAYEDYVNNFYQPLAEAIDARQRLIELYHDLGNRSMTRFWQSELLRADQGGGEQRNERSRSLASKAAVELANNYYDQFRAIKLVEPLQQNLGNKKAFMKSALDMYATVQDYAYAEQVTEASFLTAEIYAHFADALLNSERPAGLDELELEEYDLLLEDQALPFEDKAIDTHLANAQRMQQGIYDRYIANSLKALAQLHPAKYAKQYRATNYVEALD